MTLSIVHSEMSTRGQVRENSAIGSECCSCRLPRTDLAGEFGARPQQITSTVTRPLCSHPPTVTWPAPSHWPRLKPPRSGLSTGLAFCYDRPVGARSTVQGRIRVPTVNRIVGNHSVAITLGGGRCYFVQEEGRTNLSEAMAPRGGKERRRTGAKYLPEMANHQQKPRKPCLNMSICLHTLFRRCLMPLR